MALATLSGCGGRLRISAASRSAAEFEVRYEDEGSGALSESSHEGLASFPATGWWRRVSGFGLSMVRHLVEGHLGGRIELERHPERGTAVILILPIHAVAAPIATA